MPSPALIRAYRTDLAQLTGLAMNDLAIVWRSLTDADDVRDALLDLLPELAGVYGSAAGALAADWYDEVREADGVGGRFRAIPAELPDRGRTDALARWAVDPLYGGAGLEAARALTEGGFQKVIADIGRDSVRGSVTADPKAIGWQRVTAGGCDFCQMLAERGAVYTEATADFQSHDNCGCIAEPVFRT